MAAGRYVTTWGRRLVSILVGAAIGGLLTFVAFLLLPKAPQSFTVVTAIGTWAIFGGLWLVAIALVAFPIWLLAERIWRMDWRRATAAGAAFGFLLALTVVVLVTAMLAVERPGQTPWTTLEPAAVGAVMVTMALIGAIVAAAMWRLAYRRSRASDLAGVFD